MIEDDRQMFNLIQSGQYFLKVPALCKKVSKEDFTDGSVEQSNWQVQLLGARTVKINDLLHLLAVYMQLLWRVDGT